MDLGKRSWPRKIEINILHYIDPSQNMEKVVYILFKQQNLIFNGALYSYQNYDCSDADIKAVNSNLFKCW